MNEESWNLKHYVLNSQLNYICQISNRNLKWIAPWLLFLMLTYHWKSFFFRLDQPVCMWSQNVFTVYVYWLIESGPRLTSTKHCKTVMRCTPCSDDARVATMAAEKAILCVLFEGFSDKIYCTFYFTFCKKKLPIFILLCCVTYFALSIERTWHTFHYWLYSV